MRVLLASSLLLATACSPLPNPLDGPCSSLDVDAVEGQPGFFKVRFKNAVYVMVPEETTTGAVRLLDRKASVMWLQIPVKSMLMDNRAGQRLVDSCTHAEQRAAVSAVNKIKR